MSRTYTTHEILENNGRNEKPVWIIVKGAVYDVTKFLKDHPGGDELILEYAGKDATKAFNDAGHSVDAIQDMKLYKIGIVDNQSAQRCCNASANFSKETNKMSTDTATTDEKYYQKEKKRFKLCFCF